MLIFINTTKSKKNACDTQTKTKPTIGETAGLWWCDVSGVILFEQVRAQNSIQFFFTITLVFPTTIIASDYPATVFATLLVVLV